MVVRRILLTTVVFTVLCFVLASQAFANEILVWPVKGEVVKQYAPAEHRGIDISANVGDPVVATQDGIVYWTGKTPSGEPCMSIDHAGGLTSTYLPVQPSVQKGQVVKAGEVIGTISSEVDKSSDVPHLHLGIFYTASRDNKSYLNPCELLANPGAQVEGKAVEEVAGKPVQVVPSIEIPRNVPEVVTPTSSSPQVEKSNKPKVENPNSSYKPNSVYIKQPGPQIERPQIEKPIAPVSPNIIPEITRVTNSIGLPLRDRGRGVSLGHLVLATESDIVIDLDKSAGKVAYFTKQTQYLKVGLSYTKVILGIAFTMLVLAVLYFYAKRILLASRAAVIIDRSYSPASA